MVEDIITLIIALIFGFIVMKMAENRGRNKVLGFVLGFFFGILAVIGYWIAGKSKKKQDEELSLIHI